MQNDQRREATEDSLFAFHAKSKEERSGMALCLSGGGYRAALFHLGALRRLNELGILSQVDTISAVSGGSLLAAHLAERISEWPAAGEVLPDWEEQVAAPFRQFTGNNIRTKPVLHRLLPWNWGRPNTAVRVLTRRLEQELTDLRLGELPDRPRYIFTSTDMVYGRIWTFEKEGVGRIDADRLPQPDWRVARAVAASSCFPPVFAPMLIGLTPGSNGRAGGHPEPPTQPTDRSHLTDGATYDNTGVEAIWEDYATILVSDGGGTFDTNWRNFWLWRLRRYQAITSARVRVVQQRWLFASFRANLFDGAVWGIDEPKWDNHGVEMPIRYPRDLIEEVISEVRTDIDAFNEAEQKVLENHGYLMVDAAIRGMASSLPSREGTLVVPHPEWMDADRVREALKDSDSRRLLGRPFKKHPLDIIFD